MIERLPITSLFPISTVSADEAFRVFDVERPLEDRRREIDIQRDMFRHKNPYFYSLLRTFYKGWYREIVKSKSLPYSLEREQFRKLNYGSYDVGITVGYTAIDLEALILPAIKPGDLSSWIRYHGETIKADLAGFAIMLGSDDSILNRYGPDTTAIFRKEPALVACVDRYFPGEVNNDLIKSVSTRTFARGLTDVVSAFKYYDIIKSTIWKLKAISKPTLSS